MPETICTSTVFIFYTLISFLSSTLRWCQPSPPYDLDPVTPDDALMVGEGHWVSHTGLVSNVKWLVELFPCSKKGPGSNFSFAIFSYNAGFQVKVVALQCSQWPLCIYIYSPQGSEQCLNGTQTACWNICLSWKPHLFLNVQQWT